MKREVLNAGDLIEIMRGEPAKANGRAKSKLGVGLRRTFSFLGRGRSKRDSTKGNAQREPLAALAANSAQPQPKLAAARGVKPAAGVPTVRRLSFVGRSSARAP